MACRRLLDARGGWGDAESTGRRHHREQVDSPEKHQPRRARGPTEGTLPMEGRLGARRPMSAGNLVAIQGEVSV